MSEIGLWKKTFGWITGILTALTILFWIFWGKSPFVPGFVLWLSLMTALSGILAFAGSAFAPRTQRERVVGRVRVLRDPASEPARSEPSSQAPIAQDPGDLRLSGQVDKLEGWIRGS
jgi:hypothetical protein